MSVIEDLKKTVDTTPFFAAVGVTDLAVEKVRVAGLRANELRTELSADLEPTALQARATKVADQVKEIPAVAINQSMVVGGRLAEGYGDLATRGKSLFDRVRTQKATQDLVAQANTTVSQAKGAVTATRNAAAQVERSAKATITTGRKEAVKVADVVADSLAEETQVAEAEVTNSVKRTRTAAKRTSTTTKTAAKKSTTAAKGATTSARKTAKAAPKAARKAAAKVGD